MREATIQDMELGNLIFGNSRGKYVVEPRMKYQDAFYEFLEALKLDGYGYPTDRNREMADERTNTSFENDTFLIRPYYWGEEEEIQDLPNFVYKPDNITIDWYKYPMRDAYCNQNISIKRFKEILKACLASVQESK
jgi:hypothetical protein